MIDVCTPYMPAADQVLPWLRRIDQTRQYSNRGPLAHELAVQIASELTLQSRPKRVVPVSNGTASLELVLKALQLKPGTLVGVPSITYVATGLAVLNAGLTPVVLDVALPDYQLSPWSVPSNVSYVVPVAAYGHPVDVGLWEEWLRLRGRGFVLVDCAGCFPYQPLSYRKDVAFSFSMHATKPLGTGEGGFVVTTDESLADSVSDLACFGTSAPGGGNYKLSEYHAAVGLASLDPGFQFAKALLLGNLVDAYRQGLASTRFQPVFQRQCGSLLVVRRTLGRHIEEASGRLAVAGFQTKQWYRPFLHEHAAFAPYCKGSYPTASAACAGLLGLPFHAHMVTSDAERVCEVLRSID
jgi:dTDP-4-amino-4,6-dideoxygalactose transaminase